MKIAITGGTAGIGEALGKIYQSKGHEVLALSRRNGYNIRSVPKVADAIEPCDMFVNNAQSGFAQTELLYEVWRRWQGQNKKILVISTHLTNYPTSILPDWDEYWLQKRTLEEACSQLSYKSLFPNIILVKPGAVKTQLASVPGSPEADEWAETLINILELNPTLHIPEIALTTIPKHGQ